MGGGKNHRFNLSDEFLIKDNHIASNKDIRNIIKNAIKIKKGRKKVHNCTHSIYFGVQ